MVFSDDFLHFLKIKKKFVDFNYLVALSYLDAGLDRCTWIMHTIARF